MSGQEPPQWEEGREAGKSLDGQKQQTRMFTLPLLDLGLKPRGSDPKEPKGHDEEHMMSEALQFLKQKEYERARSVAEMVLRANPANQTVEEHGRSMAGAEVHADGRQWRSSEDERLGRRYEEIYCDEGHIQDLMATQVKEPKNERQCNDCCEEQSNCDDRYYKQGKFEQEFSDKDEIDVAEQQELDEDISDVHDYHANLNFYEWIEALIRISFIKVHKGSLSSRFETMVEENIARFAMKRLKDSSYLQFADVTVQNTLNETNMELALRKIFDYFIAISKSTNAKKPQDNKDVTMNVNHLIAMSSKMELYDPRYTIKKLVELFSLVTLDVDALPQEHPNNQTTEMIFFEFLEFLFRISKLKGESSEVRDGRVEGGEGIDHDDDEDD
ncbi:hypothetical protein GUITHDRAFT_149231 [Guillardia theta CCMP2712]|uniref:Uncharacterized protein n=1 Tax=Guillardia theta (strain CCMP2712) TaxID=905079 RepID=L1I6M4_GUITC|nr:hypothetical protein GUITHDRAFT_149231 [Guillardia theta CCMP2712]EKX31534.1 hypothetical protein GUITHDRAFT_149231 [Guillardia theta CCMP2712]|eukprot:XP_005818514.1 hypothetical protein GUITHDRAFT_149231 [Guillardia theta CCMP2712]